MLSCLFFFFFFFNDTATTEIYTLSLHDALPIYTLKYGQQWQKDKNEASCFEQDRKSTRLNSSHQIISYAVFCLKKKKKYVVRYMNKIIKGNMENSGKCSMWC